MLTRTRQYERRATSTQITCTLDANSIPVKAPSSGLGVICYSRSRSLPVISFPIYSQPSSLQPFTTAPFLLLYSLFYVLAVLAILPRTFILKLSLLHILLWQAWKCAVGLDVVSVLSTNSSRLEYKLARLHHWSLSLAL